MPEVIEVRCPECGAALKVDAQTGMVLQHHTVARTPKVDLDRAQEQLKQQRTERESRFQQSVDAEKRRNELLSRKFDQSLRRVRDNPDEPRPLREVDLD